jgi:hypothetical protein
MKELPLEMILGVVRHTLTGVGAALASKGYLETSQVEVVVGAIVTLIGVLWSQYRKIKRA